MAKARILIADDHEMILHGLRHVLERQVGWEICGEAHNGREAVALALQLKPDVVVLDYSMPELNGLEATRQIKKALPRTEVLMLTVHDKEKVVREVLAAGARGYLFKSDVGEILVRAVESLRQHRPFFTPRVLDMVVKGYLEPGALDQETELESGGLTPREREIVQLVAEGKSSKEVAERLGISVSTAETHRTNVMQKLGLHSVAELVRYAIRNKIIDP